jgi:hypothetical protein
MGHGQKTSIIFNKILGGSNNSPKAHLNLWNQRASVMIWSHHVPPKVVNHFEPSPNQIKRMYQTYIRNRSFNEQLGFSGHISSLADK